MYGIKVTERGGINPKASNNSKEIIKTLYYAMKHNKVFYQFQRSFLPLSGLGREEEGVIDSRTYWQGQHHEIDEYLYFPVPRGIGANSKYVSECPKVIRDVNCLNRMLMTRDRDPHEPVPYMSKAEAIGYYVSYVLSDRRGKKLPTSVVVENAFGVFGLLLFTVLFFAFLASMSKAIAIGVGFMLFFFGTIALLGIWNHH
jgi:hypothetical protein